MASFARISGRRLSPVRLLAALGGLWLAFAAAGAAAQAPKASPDGETKVILKRSDCTRLTAHHPVPDATYQPGVDVHGRAVAPADLAGSPQIAMPDEITIAITVELEKRFGIPAGHFYKPEAGIGTVVVKPDGSATFNGQPLTDPEQSALAYLCQRQGPLGPR
ncbi:MAG TPA: hypothetical protein VGO34_03090 [Alphaproteobacteria bacterium]|jgi:hypothetical protein